MDGTLTWRLYEQPRVPIDLNDRVRGGLSRARLEDLPSTVESGDVVIAYEPEEGVAATAHVQEIDRDRRVAYLAVDWESLRDDSQGVVVATKLTNEAQSRTTAPTRPTVRPLATV